MKSHFYGLNARMTQQILCRDLSTDRWTKYGAVPRGEGKVKLGKKNKT